MTTRTELIARHRYIADNDVNFEMRELAMATADMLEADAVNDDLTIAYMSGWQASKGATLEHHIAERLGMMVAMAKPAGCEAVTDWSAA